MEKYISFIAFAFDHRKMDTIETDYVLHLQGPGGSTDADVSMGTADIQL